MNVPNDICTARQNQMFLKCQICTSDSYISGTFASQKSGHSSLLSQAGESSLRCWTPVLLELKKLPVLNTSLLDWKVHGNGPQQSSETEVCSWFLPVLVPPSRQLSQITGERLSAMAVSWRRKANSFPRWTLGSILIVLSQLSGAGLPSQVQLFLVSLSWLLLQM